jgi:transposase
MKILTVGLDIAKQIFQAHGVDRTGKVVLRKRLRRAEVSSFFAGVEPCLIGLEAGGGAHYWFSSVELTGAHGTPDRAAVCKALCEVAEE